MKKIFYLILVVLTISCTNENETYDNTNSTTKTNENIFLRNTSTNDLSKDPTFILYAESEDNVLEKVKDRNSMLLLNNNVTEENLSSLVYLAGFNDTNEFTTYYSNQYSLILELKEKYGFDKLSQEELNTILLNSFNSYYGVNESAKLGPCERKLRNDLAINATEAFAAHLACGSLDLTVIGGILCHGAVVTWHYYQNDNAILEYENCIK